MRIRRALRPFQLLKKKWHYFKYGIIMTVLLAGALSMRIEDVNHDALPSRRILKSKEKPKCTSDSSHGCMNGESRLSNNTHKAAVSSKLKQYQKEKVVRPRNTRIHTQGHVARRTESLSNDTTKQERARWFIDRYDLQWEEEMSQPPGTLADSWMSCRQVHSDVQPRLGAVLTWMSRARIVKVQAGVEGNMTTSKHTGKGAKLIFYFQDGSKALFKPKMQDRTDISGKFRIGHMGRDRHNAEIAAYHLQRLLGFNRAPLTVGRKVDVAREIIPVAADSDLRNWTMQDGKLCLALHITWTNRLELTKSQQRAVCAENGVLEGSLTLWLPQRLSSIAFRNLSTNLYNINLLNPKYNKLKHPLSKDTAKLLDYIDMLLLDYLVQNTDRHQLDYIKTDSCAALIIDNGKSFGNPNEDYDNILKVFHHRCQLRNSTYTRLNELNGGVLGHVLQHILSRDPIAPVLWDKHYGALDRRLVILLTVIDKCIQKHGESYVLLKDNGSSSLNFRKNL